MDDYTKGEIKMGLKGLASILGTMAVVGGLFGGIAYATRTEEKTDRHRIMLEDKCKELNSERPEVRLQGRTYTLQCDKDGDPVLYEIGEGRK